jgi:CBS domain-containing protein/uncharacterized protein (DUF2267 family)
MARTMLLRDLQEPDMSLERFCHDRLVVLRSSDSAYEAARAMAHNHVGAVVVADHGRPVGIVTDRDLALRVGRALTFDHVPLREVMTPNPLTVDIGDPIEKAAALMHVMHARRLVVLDQERLAGIVSFDDLVLSPHVPRDMLRKIVFAQLADYAPGKPEGHTRPTFGVRKGARHEQRSKARRAQTLHTVGERLVKVTGLKRASDAISAFEVVVSHLARRLTADEAKDFASQLPAILREKVLRRSSAPDLHVTRESIEKAMARRLDCGRVRAAELVSRIGHAMGEFVSEGELADVRGQLPKDLKPIFQRAA